MSQGHRGSHESAHGLGRRGSGRDRDRASGTAFYDCVLLKTSSSARHETFALIIIIWLIGLLEMVGWRGELPLKVG